MEEFIEMSDEELLAYLMGEKKTNKKNLRKMVDVWNKRRKEDGGFDATDMLL